MTPVQNLTLFAQALRERGLTVTPDQTSDMASSLLLVDPASRSQVSAAFRCLTINRPSERQPFEEEFNRFFDGLHVPKMTEQQHTSRRSQSDSTPLLQPDDLADEGETDDRAGTSAVERVGSRDFGDLDDNDLAEARRLVMSMFWEPTDVKTRRWARADHGSRPDMRRTLHSAVGPTGDLMKVEMRSRRKRQRPLIIIADISGSMERYAELFLVFAHAAQRRLRHVEAFTFSTELTRITEDMRRRDTRAALERVTDSVDDWSGGTQIGQALATWNKEWSRRLTRGGPVVLILSDGWDCGDPELLSEEMARLSRSVHKVLWLNPLVAHKNYEPTTRGMQAVLPHIDDLLPAASVSDLRGVVRILESSSRTAI